MPANVRSSWAQGLIEEEQDLGEFDAEFDAELDEDAELDDLDGDLDDDDLIDLDDEYDGADEEDRPHPGPGKYEE